MIPIVIWEEGELALADLAPPYALIAGRDACLRVKSLLASGQMAPGRAGSTAWIEGGVNQRDVRERQEVIAQARRYISGFTLETEAQAFVAGYERHLEQDPGAQAARLIAHAIQLDHPEAAWRHLPEELRPALLPPEA